MNYTVPLFLALFATAAAQAQSTTTISVGPQVGINAATANYSLGGRNYNEIHQVGGEIGGTVIAVRKHMALQASLLYAQRGFRINDAHYPTPVPGVVNSVVYSTQKETHLLNYLTLPVSASYSLKSDGQGIQVFAGGYVSLLLHGQTTYNNSYEIRNPQDPSTTLLIVYQQSVKVKPGTEYPAPVWGATSTDKHTYSRPVDAGVQAGIGYRYKQALLQVGYNFGLVDLGPAFPIKNLSGPSYYHRAVYISASYLFDLKK